MGMLKKFFRQYFVEVAMIEAKFTLFQMQQEGMLGHTSELVESTFSKNDSMSLMWAAPCMNSSLLWWTR